MSDMLQLVFRAKKTSARVSDKLMKHGGLVYAHVKKLFFFFAPSDSPFRS